MSEHLTTGMPVKTLDNVGAITRLTALWGLAESGLGGIMFALKIPFTGFLIGAVAIVILSLIAKFSNYRYRQIITATIIVIMVKASVSPHSPLPAYLAVGFQGFTAAILFSTIRSHNLAAVLLGMISMVESSLQKVIVLTVLFGNSIWEAINNVGSEIAEIFSFDTDLNFALWIIVIHALVYAVWGGIVGMFAATAPVKIQQHKASILTSYERRKAAKPAITSLSATGRKRERWLAYAIVLAFIVLVFILSGADSRQIGTIILRSVAAVLLLIFVVQPILRFFFQKWLRRRTKEEEIRSEEVMRMLPGLRSFLPDAYALAKAHTGFFRRLGSFIVAMIILTLYAEGEEPYRHL